MTKAIGVELTCRGHETRYDLNLSCHKEYEIAMTAWNSTAETPLKALNHNNMWRVRTFGGDVIKISKYVRYGKEL